MRSSIRRLILAYCVNAAFIAHLPHFPPPRSWRCIARQMRFLWPLAKMYAKWREIKFCQEIRNARGAKTVLSAIFFFSARSADSAAGSDVVHAHPSETAAFNSVKTEAPLAAPEGKRRSDDSNHSNNHHRGSNSSAGANSAYSLKVSAFLARAKTIKQMRWKRHPLSPSTLLLFTCFHALRASRPRAKTQKSDNALRFCHVRIPFFPPPPDVPPD